LPKNSNMVGFKYRPGDGYVSDDEGDEDGTLSTGATSLDDADFFVEQGGRHLDDDGGLYHHHHTIETQSLVSTALSSCEPPAKVPFQELIDNSVKLMQRYPPRTLVALATRYYGQEQVNELLAETSPAGIRMMEAPPAWASTPTAKADWVLKQRARERRGLSAKNRRDRRREKKRARSRSRSRGSSVTRGGQGSERERSRGASVTRGGQGSEREQTANDDSSWSTSSRGRGGRSNRNSGAPAVNSKIIQKYLTDNSHTIPVIAIGHGTGDDEERRRRRKRRKLAIAGVAVVAVASIVAGAVIQNRQDVALLPNSGEPAASMVGETSRMSTAASGTSIEKKQPIPVERAPRVIEEIRVPQPVVGQVSTPKVAYSSATTNILVPGQEATTLAHVHDGGDTLRPLLQLGQRTRGAVAVIAKRLVKLQPILQFGQWTGSAVSVISKRLATGLAKLDNPRLVLMKPILQFGGWTKDVVGGMWKRAATGLAKLGKMVHDAPNVHDVGMALKEAYDSPGGQEVACALQDASILSHYGKY
jgi:hypothetical protein